MIYTSFWKIPKGERQYLGNQEGQTKRNTCLIKGFLTLLRRNAARVPSATISTPENVGSSWFQWSLRDGGSSVVAGQRSHGGAAGAAVPPHHLQHRAAGLQEDLGESLSDGLDPQHVCRLLLTLLLMRTATRGIQQRGEDLEIWGGWSLGKVLTVPCLRVYPSVYICVLFAYCIA